MPLEVVSNTSPILALLGIGRLDLLRALYGGVSVPEAVYREVEMGKGKSVYADLARIDWITIRPVTSQTIHPFAQGLGRGETEAIILCQEREADLLILDDKNARRAALRLGLPVLGSIGILLEAKRAGLVPTVQPLLEQMRLTSSWLKPQLFRQALILAGEDG